MNTSKLINVCISIIKVIKLKYLLTNFSAFFAIALVTAIGLIIRLNMLRRRKKFRNGGYARNFPLLRYNALMK